MAGKEKGMNIVGVTHDSVDELPQNYLQFRGNFHVNIHRHFTQFPSFMINFCLVSFPKTKRSPCCSKQFQTRGPTIEFCPIESAKAIFGKI